jgi:hypothetical protein
VRRCKREKYKEESYIKGKKYKEGKGMKGKDRYNNKLKRVKEL